MLNPNEFNDDAAEVAGMIADAGCWVGCDDGLGGTALYQAIVTQNPERVMHTFGLRALDEANASGGRPAVFLFAASDAAQIPDGALLYHPYGTDIQEQWTAWFRKAEYYSVGTVSLGTYILAFSGGMR